jgi:hypothetical protein
MQGQFAVTTARIRSAEISQVVFPTQHPVFLRLSARDKRIGFQQAFMPV